MSNTINTHNGTAYKKAGRYWFKDWASFVAENVLGVHVEPAELTEAEWLELKHATKNNKDD